eukprot:maker-scaffold441_size170131-snap-gene-0.29 protein:Tk02640 transcript:maker-scaffold441_size170131-snap-gene-0.29-mRNA-1 annotation:"low quality protein: proto-oncogene tyrosine-protein kinase receptor ret-like"
MLLDEGGYQFLLPENVPAPVHLGLLGLARTWFASCPEQIVDCSLVLKDPRHNEFIVMDNNSLVVQRQFDRERDEETSFGGEIRCQWTNGEGEVSLGVSAKFTLDIQDVDDNTPQPQDAIIIQPKTSTLVKGDLIEFPTIFYDADLPSTNLYSLEFPGIDFLKNGTILQSMPYECRGSRIMDICRKSGGKFSGTVLYLEPKQLEVVEDLQIPINGLRIQIQCLSHVTKSGSNPSTQASASFDMLLRHPHLSDPEPSLRTNLEDVEQSYSQSMGDNPIQVVMRRTITSNASTYTRVAELLTIREISAFKRVFVQVFHFEELELGDDSQDINEEDFHQVEIQDTPFMLTFDRQILFVNRPERLQPSNQFRLEFAFETPESTSMGKNVTVIVAIEDAPDSPGCLGGSRSSILCSEFSLQEECRASCGEGSTQLDNHCSWVSEDRENSTQTYSTCTIDSITCPDLRCDQLEQLSGLCPQDCVDRDHLYGMPPLRGSVDRDPGLGQLPVTLSNRVCTCSGDSCSCIGANLTYSIWGEERDMDDEEALVLGHGKAWREAVDESICDGSCWFWFLATGGLALWVVVLVAATVYRKRTWAKALASGVSKPVSPSLMSPFLRTATQDYDRSVGSANTATTSIASRAALMMARDPFECNMPNLPPVDAKWEFPREDLVLEEVIGEGEFGKVMRAMAFFKSDTKV